MSIIALWLSLAFGVLAAYCAQRSFAISTANEPLEPWPGVPEFIHDVAGYVLERRDRERRRGLAYAWQNVATYCGIGTALEAVGAAQNTAPGYAAAAVGIFIAIGGVFYHAYKGREDYVLAGAQAVREAFLLTYKHGFPKGIDADEMFAYKHPVETLLLNEPWFRIRRLVLILSNATRR